MVIWRPSGACWATPEPARAVGYLRWRRICCSPSAGTRCQCFPGSDRHRGLGPEEKCIFSGFGRCELCRNYLARLRSSLVYQPVLVQLMQLLKVLKRHAALLRTSPLPDAFVRHLRRGAQIYDEVRLHVNGLFDELIPLLQRIVHALLQRAVSSHVLHEAIAAARWVMDKISVSGQTGRRE